MMTAKPAIPFSLKSILAVAVLVVVGGGAAWSLGNIVKPPPQAVTLNDGHFHDGKTGRDAETRQVLERLAAADVVFLGEIHDQPSHRAFQAALVKELASRVPGLALGLEFFTRDDQPLLEEVASGRISEVAFRSRVRTSGGQPYRELITLARRRGLRLLGLNLPRPVVSLVAREGWESLPARERARWPRPAEASAEYGRLVRRAYHEFPEHHRGSFGHFLTAQTLWDSTMAESIARHLEDGRSRPLVVVVGMMHVAYGLGIPARLRAKTGASSLIVLHAQALEEERVFPGRPIADYIWYPDSMTVAASAGGPADRTPGGRAP